MKGHFLITGGAGRIAVPFAQRLLAEGADRITLVDDFDPEYPRAVKEVRLRSLLQRSEVELVEGDMLDPHVEERVFSVGQVDVIIHLATKYSAVDPQRQHRVNVGGALQALEWMRRHRVSNLVLGSTTDARDDDASARAIARTPVSLHAAGAIAAEEFARTQARLHRADITAVRIGDVIGPGSGGPFASLAEDVLLNRPLGLAPHAMLHPVLLNDVLDALISAVIAVGPSAFRIVEVGSHGPVSVRDLVERIEVASDRSASWSERVVAGSGSRSPLQKEGTGVELHPASAGLDEAIRATITALQATKAF